MILFSFMKILYFIIICFITRVVYADGLDEVTIYQNGKLIEITNSFVDKKISVNIGDTLRFEVWTDWGGTLAGELEILTISDSSRVRLKRCYPQKDEAVFILIVTEEMLQKTYEFTYHYKDSPWDIEEKIKPWKFAVLNLL